MLALGIGDTKKLPLCVFFSKMMLQTDKAVNFFTGGTVSCQSMNIV